MEILDLNFPFIALNIGLALAAICIALLIVTTAVHWYADRRKKRLSAYDKTNKLLVMSYLDGNTPKVAVVKSMRDEPLEAMHLLMEISRKLQPNAQHQLLPLFDEMPEINEEISSMGSPQTKRRLQAAERLAYLKNETCTVALYDALEDEVLAVRYCAACSLAAHGKTEFIEPTLLAFDTEFEINWLRLVEIIQIYGPSAIPELLRILENREGKFSNNILNVAIRSLGTFKSPLALEPLIQLLDHADTSIRRTTALALGDIGDPSAISPVSKLSHDPDSRVRNKVAEAMGKLHAETQIPNLADALSDSSWWVRYSAAQALHSLGRPGIDKLEEIMKSTPDIYAQRMCRQILNKHDVHDTLPIPS